MIRFSLFIVSVLLLSSCQNKGGAKHDTTDSLATVRKTQSNQSRPLMHTDTLQFIHFEGNFDYWSCVFLNSSKDTVGLVTDTMIADNFKNRLFEVKWFTDTIEVAGDGGSKQAANRMSHFKLLKGKPFIAPITEEQIIRDVRNIPEVQSGAEQVAIAERPTEGKDYYLVETGTHEEDRFARFYMFRVYTYPVYRITVYDAAENTELSLEQWRKP